MTSYKESFNSNKQSFILLGDSILKNNAYVSDGKGIEELLAERTDGKSICLARDSSTISNVYNQVEEIPHDFNSNYTTVFLSAGGNDILTHYVEGENDSNDTSVLGHMFTSYKNLIQSIKNKLPKANIVLLDIYYPDSNTYQKYHSIINQWNNMIYNYAREPQNNIFSVLKVSNVLTKDDDFSSGIEPSSNGGKKLVEAILNNY
jgi:hypothetical protein